MNEEKRIKYGIIGCCVGIVIGFAVGFPIFFQLPYANRGTIGLPFMLILVLATCTAGGIIGVKRAIKEEERADRNE